jgi:hypothetical protein
MASKLNAAKEHYIAPSFKELDANAARTELEATACRKIRAQRRCCLR